MPWILDTDPGVDDAAALIAAERLSLGLTAITVVHGNVPLQNTVANTLRLKQLLGSPLPVYPGAERPLLQEPCHAWEVHGRDGLGDQEWPKLTVHAEQQHAALHIIDAAHRFGGALKILAVGPLTNIALALRLEPKLPDLVQRLVVMGGTHSGRGNTSMVGEFNFYADPEAAAMVLAAGWKIQLIPWEPTLENLVPVDMLPPPGADPVSDAFRRISAHLVRRVKERTGVEGLLMCDFAALGAALDPSIGVTQELYGAVETEGRYSRGLLALDYAGCSGQEPNLSVYTQFDRGRLTALFAEAFAKE